MEHFERFSLRIAARHGDDGARQKPQSARGVAFRRVFRCSKSCAEHQVSAEADSRVRRLARTRSRMASICPSSHIVAAASAKAPTPGKTMASALAISDASAVMRASPPAATRPRSDGLSVALLHRSPQSFASPTGRPGCRQRIAHARVGLDRLRHRAPPP